MQNSWRVFKQRAGENPPSLKPWTQRQLGRDGEAADIASWFIQVKFGPARKPGKINSVSISAPCSFKIGTQSASECWERSGINWLTQQFVPEMTAPGFLPFSAGQ